MSAKIVHAAGTRGSDTTGTSESSSAFDTDGDGLSDVREAELGTDPNKWDTDGDSINDGDEVASGHDPNSDQSFPPRFVSTSCSGSNFGSYARVTNSWLPIEPTTLSPGSVAAVEQLMQQKGFPTTIPESPTLENGYRVGGSEMGQEAYISKPAVDMPDSGAKRLRVWLETKPAATIEQKRIMLMVARQTKGADGDAGDIEVRVQTSAVPFTIAVGDTLSAPVDLKPDPETLPIEDFAKTSLNLVPVEVEQLNYTPEKGIRFCRWLDSFTGNSLKSDCANNDRDRFRIRIPGLVPNLTKIHIKSLGIATAVIDGQWVSKSTDGDYDVTMTEENGAMVSKWMLLVSDGDDDVEYNGIGTDNGPNDQTLLANFNSPIEVTLPEYQNAKVTFHAQKPLGDLEIQPYYLSPAGDVPPNMADLITNHLEKMKEIYRQVGVRVGYYGIVGEAVPQEWFNPGSNELANYFTPSESNLARAAVRGLSVPGKQIRIGFANAKLMDYGANLWDPPIGVRGFTDKGTDGIIVSLEPNDARDILGVTAHEVGHALGLNHTSVQSWKRWLMRGDPGEAIIWDDKSSDSKRFQSGDFDILSNSQSFYVPN